MLLLRTLFSFCILTFLLSTTAFAQLDSSRIAENREQIQQDLRLLGDELEELAAAFENHLPRNTGRDLVAQVRVVDEELGNFYRAVSDASEETALSEFYSLDAELHRLLALALYDTENSNVELALLGVIDADDLLHDSVLQVNDTPDPPTLRDEIIDRCYALELHSLRLSDNIRDTVGLGADAKPLRAAARQLVFEAAEFQDAATDGASRASLQRMFNRIDQDLYGLINQLSYSDYTPRFTNQLDRIQDIHEQLGKLLYAEPEAADIYVEER